MPQSWINNSWESDNCTTYLVLDEDIDKTDFEDKLTQMLHNNSKMWKEFGIALNVEGIWDYIGYSTFK